MIDNYQMNSAFAMFEIIDEMIL